MSYLLKANDAPTRNVFYVGVEKGRAKLHGKKLALRFTRENAEKIKRQLEAVHNLDWEIVEDVW